MPTITRSARHDRRWPLRTRWLIVKARERETWRELWADLVYVVIG